MANGERVPTPEEVLAACRRFLASAGTQQVDYESLSLVRGHAKRVADELATKLRATNPKLPEPSGE